jgi:predicted ArsR family transcriptional regulator
MIEPVVDPDSPLNAPSKASVARVLREEAPKWVSVAVIAQRASLTPSRAYRTLRALLEDGLVESRTLKGFPGRAPTVWRLTRGDA